METIDTYKLFLMAIQMGDITHAADAMNIDRAAANRVIQALEASIGHKLLSSMDRGCQLTQKGEEIWEDINKIVLHDDTMRQKVHLENRQEKFRIVSTQALITNYLAYILPDFFKEYPTVSFEVIVADDYKTLKNITYDVAIMPKSAHETTFVQENLFTTTLELYASKEYILKHGTIDSLEDIRQHQFIVYGTQSKFNLALSSWPLDTLQKSHHQEAHISVQCVRTMIKFAEAGLGVIGIYHKTVDLQKAKLEKISQSIIQKNSLLCLTYPEKSLNNPCFKKFKHYLYEFITKNDMG